MTHSGPKAAVLCCVAYALIILLVSVFVAGPGQWQQHHREILLRHNAYRELHGSRPLTWAPELATEAQRRMCRDSPIQSLYGENRAIGYEGLASVDAWYAESARYDFAQPGFGTESGHFTQLLWNTSAKVGCGLALCDNILHVTCLYSPPGNIVNRGEFSRNVPARQH